MTTNYIHFRCLHFSCSLFYTLSSRRSLACYNYCDTANILRLSLSFRATQMFRRVCSTKTNTSLLNDFHLLRLGWLNTLLSSCKTNCYCTIVWNEVHFWTMNTDLYVLICSVYAMFTKENSQGLGFFST